MLFSWFEVLLMIGIFQGLAVVPVLLFSRPKALNKTLLGIAILTFCLLFIKILLNATKLSHEPSFRYLPIAFELASAPLFYLYLRALTEKSFQWHAKLLLHFIPFFVAYGYALLVFCFSYFHPLVLSQDMAAKQLYYNEIKALEDWCIVISILTYLYLGYRRYRTFQYLVAANNSDNNYPTLHWLKSIIIFSSVLWLYLLVNMVVSRFGTYKLNTELYWQLYYLYSAIFIYYISFKSYRQAPPDLTQLYPVKSQPYLLSPHEQNELVSAFKNLMAIEKIYLDPTLNLQNVAQKLNVNTSVLSQMINRYFDKSFREVINELRLDDVKSKLLDSSNKASILSLALESGFNSEASFYRVFKKNTGMSPTQYIKTCNRHSTT